VVAEILSVGADLEGTAKVFYPEGETPTGSSRGGKHKDIVSCPPKRIRVRTSVEWILKRSDHRGRCA
jgi:hypothetical protein